jgi:hypothetical protein
MVVSNMIKWSFISASCEQMQSRIEQRPPAPGGAGFKQKHELWGGLCARGAQQQAGQQKQAAKESGQHCGVGNHAGQYIGFPAIRQ